MISYVNLFVFVKTTNTWYLILEHFICIVDIFKKKEIDTLDLTFLFLFPFKSKILNSKFVKLHSIIIS
jgi:hypothetical protein